MRGMTRVLSAACLFAAAAVATADDPKPGEKTGPVTNEQFVTKAAVGGLFEVESSKLAKTAATDAKVKEFAAMMIADHEKANKELKEKAKSAGVTAPTKLDEKHLRLLADLKTTRGAAFDKAFMVAQEKAHDEAVGLFRSAAKTVPDSGLKGFAEKTLPTLEDHHKMAKTLRDSLPGK